MNAPIPKPVSKPLPSHTPETPPLDSLEIWLSRILRGGVIGSSAIILLGLILVFVHHPTYFSGAATAESVIREMAFPHTLREVRTGLLEAQGRSVIVAGLFILIATPVARVLISLLLFLHQRDRLFAIITAIVLIMLITSFFLGHASG